MGLGDKQMNIRTLDLHTDKVWRMLNIDENRFASGSCDKTIKIWDANTFVCLKTLIGHRLEITSLAKWTSCSIVSGSNKEIKLWDIESGQCLQTLNAHTSWARSLIK